MKAWFAAIAALAAPIAASAVPAVPSAPTRGFITAIGRIDSGGLHGAWQEIGDLRAGRFATSADLGAYRTADIYDGTTRWRVDPSGGRHPLNSLAAQRAAVTEAWLARFVWTGQNLDGLPVSAPEMKAEAGRHYRVVTVTPAGGEPVQLWFDLVGGRLARATRWMWFFDLTTTYSDYRDAETRLLPFFIANAAADQMETIKISSYKFSSHLPRNSFARPAQAADFGVPVSGTTVSAIVYPQFTMRALVNGHAMDFLFDTGGHSILTPEATKALGLAAVGNQQTGGSGVGTLLQQDTRVAELRIGAAVLRNQHFAVLSLPYSDVEQGAKPPLAGLLGLEVAERFIVRLDYRAGTLTLLPPSAMPACSSGWRPLGFTYDMPAVNAVLDGRAAWFTVDTGNNGGLLLYRHWMQVHGVEARYDRGVKSLSYGAGGASMNWITYGTSFSIGQPPIARPMIRTTDDAGGVALSRSEAGNLGTYLLANYTITLDYGRSRGCFNYVPGYKPLPFNRTGLRAIKQDPASFLVTLINPAGPAAAAGLRKDDRIVAVDGVPATQLSEGDLTLALVRPPESHILIRYQRAGKTGETVVKTREMLR